MITSKTRDGKTFGGHYTLAELRHKIDEFGQAIACVVSYAHCVWALSRGDRTFDEIASVLNLIIDKSRCGDPIAWNRDSKPSMAPFPTIVP